jgi:signal transduction histidine kinase
VTSEGEVRVLLVDDDEDDYFLTRELLAEIPGASFRLDWVADFDAALAEFDRCAHDVFLVDYRLGRRDGLELLRAAVAKGCPAPVIVLTGQGERAVDLEAMRAGAADYLVKDRLDAPTLERAIRYALQQRRSEAELERKVRERTAELERANAKLQETDRRKDEFLAMLGHELRNPLAPIRNALHLIRLRGDPPEGDVRESWDVIERQVEHLARLVDDLLDVSRITRGKINLQKERVDLAAVVGRAVEGSRPLLAARRHAFAVCPAGEPLPVDADPVRLAQVFLNLLNNAAKYTPEGGGVTLTVEKVPPAAAGGPERALVRVRDTGVGISKEMLASVFELFTQAASTLDRSEGGLGIGLTLVRRLVEMHGGSVRAFSEGPGRGSEFAVWLPLAPGPLTGHEPGEPRPPPPAPPRRVLIVDDLPDSAESLAKLMRLLGHDVRTASDGPSCFRAAEEFRPELVVLDIGLPGMSGYEVARALRARPDLGPPVLVALTGYGGEEDRQRSREAGFTRHLVKPVDLDELRHLLATLPARAE